MKLVPATRGVTALDAGAIVVVAAMGRANHDEGILGARDIGLAATVWPFLVGAAVGWVHRAEGCPKSRAWRPTVH